MILTNIHTNKSMILSEDCSVVEINNTTVINMYRLFPSPKYTSVVDSFGSNPVESLLLNDRDWLPDDNEEYIKDCFKSSLLSLSNKNIVTLSTDSDLSKCISDIISKTRITLDIYPISSFDVRKELLDVDKYFTEEICERFGLTGLHSDEKYMDYRNRVSSFFTKDMSDGILNFNVIDDEIVKNIVMKIIQEHNDDKSDLFKVLNDKDAVIINDGSLYNSDIIDTIESLKSYNVRSVSIINVYHQDIYAEDVYAPENKRQDQKINTFNVRNRREKSKTTITVID